jgi:hypothetical protein
MFRFILFMALLSFGGGFYSGIQAYKRALASDNGIVHRLFGIVPPAVPNAAPPVPPVAGAPQQPVAPPPAATSSPTAPANVAPKPSTPVTTAPANPTGTANENAGTANQPSNPDATPELAQLAAQVDDYNDTLRRIQMGLNNYSVVHQRALDPKTHAQDLKPLLDQQNDLIKEITNSTGHAQNVQTEIQANPEYARLYVEAKPVVLRKSVPGDMLDLDIDKLKFIEKAP